MDVAYGEEFDEAFLLELDAVEAAAVQHFRARNDVVVPAGSSTSNAGPIEQHGQQRAAAHKTLLPGSVMLEQGCSTGKSIKPEGCHPEASNVACLYRWAVDSITVQDDAAAEGSAEDRIGRVSYNMCTKCR